MPILQSQQNIAQLLQFAGGRRVAPDCKPEQWGWHERPPSVILQNIQPLKPWNMLPKHTWSPTLLVLREELNPPEERWPLNSPLWALSCQKAFKARMRLPLHPLVASHYFNKYYVRLDIMHLLDLKGTIAIAGGSLIQYLINNCNALGRVKHFRLININRLMNEFQTRERTEHRMPAFRKDDLENAQGMWCLSSKLIKAANTRCLVPFLKHLAEQYLFPIGGYSRSVRKVFNSLDAAERLFYGAGTFLSKEQHEELVVLMNCLGRNWQYLRHLGHEANRPDWQITPKVHMTVCAVPQQAKLINPRAVQNYSEESLMGKFSKTWAATAMGPYRSSIQQTVLARWLVGLVIRSTTTFSLD